MGLIVIVLILIGIIAFVRKLLPSDSDNTSQNVGQPSLTKFDK